MLVGDDPPVKPPPSKHLDADEIAAFADGAVPARMRSVYVEHMADCDRCRVMLAHSVAFARGDESPVAGSTPEVKAIAVTVPWYQRLFRTPNLAVAMGALVLMFGGVIVFIALQNQGQGDLAMSEKPDSAKQVAVEPNYNAANANAAATYQAPGISDQMPASSNAAAVANAAALPQATPASPTEERKERDMAKTGFTADGIAVTDSTTSASGQPAAESQPVMKAAPPPPAPADREKLPMKDEAGDDKKKGDEDRADLGAMKRASRETPLGAGVQRRTGPINTQQNQISQQQVFDYPAAKPVTKIVSGKTFENRDGAWYDSAYRGQATLNFRRKTREYDALDRDLRRIADSVGGTVVVVWKGKAYRVQ